MTGMHWTTAQAVAAERAADLAKAAAEHRRAAKAREWVRAGATEENGKWRRARMRWRVSQA